MAASECPPRSRKRSLIPMGLSSRTSCQIWTSLCSTSFEATHKTASALDVCFPALAGPYGRACRSLTVNLPEIRKPTEPYSPAAFPLGSFASHRPWDCNPSAARCSRLDISRHPLVPTPQLPLGSPGDGKKRSFDFTDLYTKSSNLEYKVFTPQMNQTSVRKHPP